MARSVRVLVVDDSAYVRKAVREMLSRSPSIEVVGASRNGTEALELVAQMKPDVVLCDVMMPDVNGVEFVERQMARRPLPILLMSSLERTEPDVLRGLTAGAVDFIQKPTGLASDRLFAVAA